MTAHYTDDTVTLHHGDALEVARTLPAASVRTIVTSPPYYGLRDYGTDGQIGAEATLAEYVGNLVALFRELRRTLTDDGTLWLNLGDSYASRTKGTGGGHGTSTLTSAGIGKANAVARQHTGEPRRLLLDVAEKNLLGVPWRVAFALQDDGWILRSDIIWAKPNPMPESVTDRPTKAHEYLFLLAKSPRYYYNADAIREDAASFGRQGSARGTAAGAKNEAIDARWHKAPADRYDIAGRNKRSVWEVSPVPFPGAHFAVYPPELIRPCILAGSQPGDTVLDPFSGSGTTGAVATYEGRRYVGIDLNAEYLDLSLRTRFAAPPLNFGEELGA